MRGLKRGLALALVALALVLGWSSWRAWQARSGLLEARDTAKIVRGQLSDGDLDVALAALPALRLELDRATARTSGPTWGISARVPIVGRNFVAVRRAALAAQVIGAEALPEASAALDIARRQRLLRSGRVDLAVVTKLATHVNRASLALDRAQELLSPQPRLLLPNVGSGMAEARATTGELHAAVSTARQALAIAPGMLGADRPRRLIVAVQNDAEARATGGLIGAFAILTTDRGAIKLERTGINDELPVLKRQQPNDPAAARTWVNLGSTSAWYDVNLTPHFPDVAQNLAGLWRVKTGQQVDGVIALDALVMSHLLSATGPVKLTDGTTVSATNVSSFVGYDEYVRYPDVPERKRVLSGLADQIFERLLAVRDADALINAVARAGSSGHLFLWSRHPSEQSQIRQGIVGGSLPTTNDPYLAVLTQNFGGNKLDYFLRRSVSIKPARKGFITVEITLRNTAPLGLPPYMTVRSDKPVPAVPYAQSEVAVSVYGALTSEVSAVTIGGRPAQMSFDRDHGHRMGTLTVELPRDNPVTISVVMSQPSGTIDYRRQPMVVADQVVSQLPIRILGQ